MSQHITEICKVLAKIPQCYAPGTQDSRSWTFAIRKVLTDLGHEKGYYVAADVLAGADWGEWGFDLSWRDYGRTWTGEEKQEWNSASLVSLPLACESEWGDLGAIKDDFEKLLQARASLKLMIFAARHQEEMQERVKVLINMIRRFEAGSVDERFVLGCFLSKPWNFFPVIVTGTGKML